MRWVLFGLLLALGACDLDRGIDDVCLANDRLAELTSYQDFSTGLAGMEKWVQRRESVKERANSDRNFALKAGELKLLFRRIQKACNKKGHLIVFDLPWWADNIVPLLPPPYDPK